MSEADVSEDVRRRVDRATGTARSAARQAGDHPVVEWGARLGYAASGLLHLVLAWLALQLVIEGGGKQASQSGALSTLAEQPLGRTLLWVLTVGFALLAVWQATEVATGREASDKAKAAGKAVVYAVLAWTAGTFALGGHSSSNKQAKDFTRTLMDAPGGRVLVGLVGVGILGVAGYHVYKGWKEKFLEDLQEHPGQWAVVAARVGYVAKGAALVVVGGLFIAAAVEQKSGEATGLDGALKWLRDLPGGPVLLVAVALGFAAYGVYSFARARYARV